MKNLIILLITGVALVSCNKEKIEPTNTPIITEPSALGSEMVGTWSADSVSMIHTDNNQLLYTETFNGYSRVISYESDNVYAETNSGNGSSATTHFVLDDATSSYRYKDANGQIGATVYSIVTVNEHYMVIDSQLNPTTTRRDFLSK